MAKRYVWLKLKEDFFQQRAIKKLRKIAGGDTYTIIYLKLQLLSLKDEGKLFYEGIEDDFMEEMALAIDEDVENVKVTLMFLEKNGLLETVKEDEYFLPEVADCIGSETAAAERKRQQRIREKEKLLIEEKSKDNEKKCDIVTAMSQNVTEMSLPVTNCHTEKEEEEDIEKEKDTTTKIDNINYIDPENLQEEEKDSSSSSFDLIKQMLEQHGISNNTKMNIMVLVRDENITVERVSEVLKAYQMKNWKSEGAIYTALRDNWNTNLEAEETEKEKQREKSAKIDKKIQEDRDKYAQQKEKAEQDRNLKDELQEFYCSLSPDIQNKIKKNAEVRSKEKYGAIAWKSMLNISVIYEVIKEYKTGVLNL